MELPPISKRRTHSSEFKARVTMEAISGRKSIQEISADHAIQIRQWKRQLLDGASELFTSDGRSKDKEEVQAKKAELFQQYCFSSRRLRLRRSLTATASSRWSWSGLEKSQLL